LRVKTDQELISLIVEYLAVNKLATQQDLRRLTKASVKRMKELADAGHFVYPKKIPVNKRHLLSDQTRWRRFDLKSGVRWENATDHRHSDFQK
jgi:hypothetical protein